MLYNCPVLACSYKVSAVCTMLFSYIQPYVFPYVQETIILNSIEEFGLLDYIAEGGPGDEATLFLHSTIRIPICTRDNNIKFNCWYIQQPEMGMYHAPVLCKQTVLGICQR